MKKLTKVQIVAVAKDVLKQIKLKTIFARSGTYFELVDGDDPAEEYNHKPFELKGVLKAGTIRQCDVCARGALVLSKARLYNDCEVVSSIYGAVIRQSEEDSYFGGLGIQAEAAFEGDWIDYYPDDEDRLVAIMNNIIRNKGSFEINKPFASKNSEAYKAYVKSGGYQL